MRWAVASLRRHGKQDECLNREMPSQGRAGHLQIISLLCVFVRASQNLHPALDSIGGSIYFKDTP